MTRYAPGDLQNLRWHLNDDPHQAMMAVAKRIWDNTADRREGMVYDACLYDDAETIASIPGLGQYISKNPTIMTRNIVKSIVDTFTASIGMARPLPMPITTEGNYGQQRRARKFGQIIEGLFHKLKVWQTSRLVARDGGLWGTGITHNYRVGKTLHHDRILPFELLIDPRDGLYGAPRNWYLRRWVDRLVLMERFPQHAALIEQANDSSGEFDIGFEATSDLVLCIEGWHLPSGDGANDGRHGISVSTGTLEFEEYKRAYAPFGVYRCFPPSAGFFGSGLAAMGRGAQYMVNEQSIAWQEGMRRQGGFICLERSANVQPNHLLAEYGVALDYDRTMPQWATPPAVNADVPKSIELIVQSFYADAGISQLSSQQLKPAGLNSGEALRTYNQLETKRFAPQERDFEDYHTDLAWQFFDLLEEALEDSPGEAFEVRGAVAKGSGKSLSALDYREVRLDRDDFTLLVMSTSALRRDPAGRIEDVETLMKIGFFSAEEGAMLLELPDVDRLRSVKLSSRRVIEDSVQKLLDGDPSDPDLYRSVMPDGFMDLSLAVQLGTLMYGDAKLQGHDEENLALVREWILDAKEKGEKAANANAKPTQPPAQGMSGDPASMPPDPTAVPPDPNAAPAAALPPEMPAATVAA